MESTIGPSASIQYLCVSDNHIRLGRGIPDGHGHLTVRYGQWAYCSAGRKDEPHEWEAIPARPLFQIRHLALMRRPAHGQGAPKDSQEEDRSE